MNLLSWIVSFLVAGASGQNDPSAKAQSEPKAESDAKPSIVLVHGAFADGSGWRPVIRLLQDDGFEVVAVQNALAALAKDIANTRRVIQAQRGRWSWSATPTAVR